MAVIVACLTVFTAAGGCTNQSVETYPTLTGSFATEADVEPLIAEQGQLWDSGFRIVFRQGGERFEGGGQLLVPQQADPADGVDGGPLLVPLGYRRPADQEPDSVEGRPARVLGVADWHAVRDRLFASLLPTGTNEGIVIHFGVDDYFLYLDSSQKFSISILDEKPSDYLIAARYSFPDMLSRGFPVFEQYMDEKGIDDRLILMSTGDKGAYSLPFLFVDRRNSFAMFVRLGRASRDYVTAASGDPMMQMAGHVVSSHTMKLINRPVSSAVRLLFMTTDTVSETLRFQPTASVDPGDIPPLNSGPGMDLEEWEQQLDQLTGRERTRGTVRYLIDGEEFFTRFVDEISRAQDSISLRMYIFDNDDYALRIADLLKRRSNEGIDVKILLDGLGTIVSTMETQESLPDSHVAPLSVRQYLEKDSAIDVRMTANPWLTGDHVKTVIIDKKRAFTGGMNIAREYRYDWHDMMVELGGPIVDRMQFEFEKAWAHAGMLGDLGYSLRRLSPKPRHADDLGEPLRLLFTRADRPEIFVAQRRAAKTARKYIFVQNAYFTDDAMLYELAQARMRGVDVRVIMPLVTDRGPITKNNALAANALLEHGVRVFIYPGMSHVKAAIFDGWACLGSANLDRWSLKLNKELNIATSEPGAVRRLEQSLFEIDFERSVELTEPFPERWSDYLIELVGDYVF